jgi:hypothetical protein
LKHSVNFAAMISAADRHRRLVFYPARHQVDGTNLSCRWVPPVERRACGSQTIEARRYLSSEYAGAGIIVVLDAFTNDPARSFRSSDRDCFMDAPTACSSLLTRPATS